MLGRKHKANDGKMRKTYDIFVHPSIPEEVVLNTVPIRSDGWCGFRTIAHHVKGNQDAYMDVKRDMLAYLRENKPMYHERYVNLRDCLDDMEKILRYGIDNPEDSTCWCPSQYWFKTPEFSQLAADTFGRPVAIYPDNDRKKPDSDEYAFKPLLHVPFNGPKKGQTRPILMQHVNNCHWSTMDLKRGGATMTWRILHQLCIQAHKTKGKDARHLRKIVWRPFLTIDKGCDENENEEKDVTFVIVDG